MMAQARTFRDLFRQARARDEFWEEWLVGDFVDALARRMSQIRLSRSALAERLQATPAYVTKVLRGDANFTIQSMAKLARATDSVVRVHLAPVGTSTRWIDRFNGQLNTASSSADHSAVIEFGEAGATSGNGTIEMAADSGANRR